MQSVAVLKIRQKRVIKFRKAQKDKEDPKDDRDQEEPPQCHTQKRSRSPPKQGTGPKLEEERVKTSLGNVLGNTETEVMWVGQGRRARAKLSRANQFRQYARPMQPGPQRTTGRWPAGNCTDAR